jgi:hypothetical protein
VALAVHQARGHLGALEGPTHAQKFPALVVRKRRFGDAVEAMAANFYLGAEAVRAGADFLAGLNWLTV